MKRRVLLLVGSFILLLMAFLGYWLATKYTTSEPTRRNTSMGEHGELSGGPVEPGKGPMIPKGGEKLSIRPRDDEGRLEGEYKFSKWDKIGDYTYKAMEPDISLYRKDGVTVYLRAKTGEIVTDTTGRNRPQRVFLTGGVEIDIDRGTEPGMLPLAKRPKDHVRILVDEVRFDNEIMTIQTNSDVELYSWEANIFGQGLLIRWTEAPSELSELRILRGRRIVVKEIPQELEVISGPGAAKKGSSGATTTRPVSMNKEAVTADSGKPAAAPSSGQDAKHIKPPPKNVYEAQLFKNVRVVSGEGTPDKRKLTGADCLTLTFQWDRSAERKKEKRETASASTTEPAVERPAPATEPAAVESAQDRTMVIEWDGELVLRPTGHVEKPSRKCYAVRATAEKDGQVVLADSQTTATCKEFLFESKEAPDGGAIQQGELSGAKDKLAAPKDKLVTLAMADGSKTVCEKIRFDRQAGKAYLDGPGEMTGPPYKPSADEKIEAPDGASPATSRPDDKVDRITWQDSVVATFAEQTIRLPKGAARTRQYIEEAVFQGKGGKVKLTQARTGDEVTCDKLVVNMTHGKSDRTYPRQAIATGNVTGRQEGTDIKADTIKLEFKEVPPEAVKPGADGRQAFVSGRAQPAMLEAQGRVRITESRKDRKGQELTAGADKLVSDLIKRSAILYGAPARAGQKAEPAHISRGPKDKLLADKICIYEITDAAGRKDVEVRVDTPGSLAFLTDKDLDSQKLEKPRIMLITWKDGMRYQGHRDIAEFLGDVRLDSGTDHMACRTMNVRFERPQPKTRPAGKADAEASKQKEPANRNLGLSMEQYSQRPIKMIQADDDVVLVRRLEDEKNRLLRRYKIRSQQLIYDVQCKRVNCFGPGNMLVENYEPPTAAAKSSSEGILGVTGGVNSPSQTAVAWTKGMDFLQELRQVVVDGDVAMRHVSGNKVVMSERLKVPDWGKLSGGRATDLTAEKLMLEFAEASKSKAQTEADTQAKADVKPDVKTKEQAALELGPGVSLGAPERFAAIRNVRIKDGPREIRRAQRVIYDRASDTVIVWGFLEGERIEDAELIYEDPATGASQVYSSPKIIWFRKNDRIITESVKGSGGR